MNNEFFKKPAFIAVSLLLICFLALDYAVVSISMMGISQSDGVSGIQIAKEFDGIDILLWLIPIAAGFLEFAMLQPGHKSASAQNVKIAKITLLAATAFFWLRYQFLMEGPFGANVNAGIGMWVSLLCAVFVMFEEQVMAMVNKKK
ncbi:MAG: hypothetical protein ACOZCO_04430 [Bacteroidota bacterium]